jgi:hypothetical protein
MRKNLVISLITGVMFVLGTSAASALILANDINYGSSTAPLVAVDANTATATLTAGDIIGISVVVDNASNDVISAIFSSLSWDATQLQYLGGGFTGAILTGTCAGFSCSPPSLLPGIGAPLLKPLSPFGQSTGVTDWLQGIAHTNTSSTNGPGPDLVANLGFQVLAGGAGTGEVRIGMIIEVNSDTVAGAGGGAFLGTVNLVDAVINPVPEPGTALLMGLGLLGLGAAGRRKS